MSERNFTESFTLNKSKVCEDTSLIKRTHILNSHSKNHRHYSEQSLSSVSRLINEGTIKCFIDHTVDTSPSIKNLLGSFSNSIVEGNSVYANLQILKSHPLRDMVIEIASDAPELCGLSVSARGLFGDADENGIEEVTDVIALHSIDFVSFPATGNGGVFENRNTKLTELDEENKKLKGEIKSCFDQISRLQLIIKYQDEKIAESNSRHTAPSQQELEKKKQAFFDDLERGL